MSGSTRRRVGTATRDAREMGAVTPILSNCKAIELALQELDQLRELKHTVTLISVAQWTMV